MNLDARFRLLVYGQVALGITAFCLAEANLGLMVVAVSLALASWYFAEGPRGRPLPRWLMNAGSLVAMAVMVLELSVRGDVGLIVAMGHFTMALQVLMLYARKSNREYAMLLVLSLIQMIGASVLSVSIVYGVLLTAYCGLALVTVLLFQIKATGDGVHQRRVAAAARAGLTVRPRRPAVVAGRGMRWQFRGAWATVGVLTALLAAGVFVVLPRSGDIPALGVQTGHDGGAKRTGFSPTVSLAGGAPTDGSTDAVLNLAVQQFGTDAGGDHRAFLLRGAALDYYDARAHQWRRGPTVGQADRQMRLRADGRRLARLAQDYAAVEATITLRDPSPRVLFVPAEPRMPGGAIGWVNSDHLDQITFNPLDRQLTAGEPKTSAITYQLRVAGLPNAGVQAQYERLHRQNLQSASLFDPLDFPGVDSEPRPDAGRPLDADTGASPEAWWDSVAALPLVSSEQVRRWRQRWAATQEQEAVTVDAPRALTEEGWDAWPGGRSRRAWDPRWIGERYARNWEVELPRVRGLTLEVLAAEGLSRDLDAAHSRDDARIATVLADYLRKNFTYELRNPWPSEDSDPVIDFLFDHRSGHCELFASALAAMCRSINIPARVITGYRASEYNALGGYYVVRQTHAHAWTEVDCGPTIGWRTYDATPSAEVRAEHAAAGPGWFSALRQVYEYLEFTWVRSVVAYDERTRQSLLSAMNRRVVRATVGPDAWPTRTWNWVTQTFGGLRLRSVGALLVLLGTVLLGVAVGSILRATWRRRQQHSALRLEKLPRRQARDLARRLRFYLDLRDTLDRHGLRRPVWQSPADFADTLRDTRPAAAEPVGSLVELFYRVRFGGHALGSDDRQRIESNLRQLETALAAQKR